MIYIGIDPGVTTGFAAWDGKLRKFIVIKSFSFWDCILEVQYYKDNFIFGCGRDSIEISGKQVKQIVIEDPNFNRPTFVRANSVNDHTFNKISQNVGSNKRDAQLLIEYCTLKQLPVTPIRPTMRKQTAKEFKTLTKYDGTTNQHGRDAAMLVFGM